MDWVTLCSLNAFNTAMAQELISAFHHVDRDDRIRVVIVTGNGSGLGGLFSLSSAISP